MDFKDLLDDDDFDEEHSEGNNPENDPLPANVLEIAGLTADFSQEYIRLAGEDAFRKLLTGILHDLSFIYHPDMAEEEDHEHARFKNLAIAFKELRNADLEQLVQLHAYDNKEEQQYRAHLNEIEERRSLLGQDYREFLRVQNALDKLVLELEKTGPIELKVFPIDLMQQTFKSIYEQTHEEMNREWEGLHPLNRNELIQDTDDVFQMQLRVFKRLLRYSQANIPLKQLCKNISKYDELILPLQNHIRSTIDTMVEHKDNPGVTVFDLDDQELTLMLALRLYQEEAQKGLFVMDRFTYESHRQICTANWFDEEQRASKLISRIRTVDDLLARSTDAREWLAFLEDYDREAVQPYLRTAKRLLDGFKTVVTLETALIYTQYELEDIFVQDTLDEFYPEYNMAESAFKFNSQSETTPGVPQALRIYLVGCETDLDLDIQKRYYHSKKKRMEGVSVDFRDLYLKKFVERAYQAAESHLIDYRLEAIDGRAVIKSKEHQESLFYMGWQPVQLDDLALQDNAGFTRPLVYAHDTPNHLRCFLGDNRLSNVEISSKRMDIPIPYDIEQVDPSAYEFTGSLIEAFSPEKNLIIPVGILVSNETISKKRKPQVSVEAAVRP